MGRMGKGGDQLNGPEGAVAPDGVNDFIHYALCRAIELNRMVAIDEDAGKTRIGEPHDYGVMNGQPTLLLYQVGGYSRSGGLPQWRHLPVINFGAVRPLDRTFRGGRSTQSGRHRQWDRLFVRAKP
jgi:hypothetical protein